MQRSKKLFIAAISFVLVTSMSACAQGGGSSNGEGSGTIWYSTKNSKELVHVAMADGIVNAAKMKGYKGEVTVAESDPAVQNQQMANLVDNMNPTAIVVNPYDSDSITDVLNRASEKGIPNAVIDNQANGASPDVSVLFDSIQSGREAGKKAVDLLTKKYGSAKGLVVNIEGDPVAQVARDRADGFYEVLSKYPDIKVVKLADSQEAEKATSAVSNAISDAKSSGNQVDLINSPTDPSTLGAIEALKTKNMWKKTDDKDHVFLISHDGMGDLLDYVRSGYVDAEVVIDIYGVGGIATELLSDYPLKGKKVPTSGTYTPKGKYLNTKVTFTKTKFGPTVYLAPIVVTAENVDNPLIWGNVKK